jgi:hypothetical protein
MNELKHGDFVQVKGIQYNSKIAGAETVWIDATYCGKDQNGNPIVAYADHTRQVLHDQIPIRHGEKRPHPADDKEEVSE